MSRKELITGSNGVENPLKLIGSMQANYFTIKGPQGNNPTLLEKREEKVPELLDILIKEIRLFNRVVNIMNEYPFNALDVGLVKVLTVADFRRREKNEGIQTDLEHSSLLEERLVERRQNPFTEEYPKYESGEVEDGTGFPKYPGGKYYYKFEDFHEELSGTMGTLSSTEKQTFYASIPYKDILKNANDEIFLMNSGQMKKLRSIILDFYTFIICLNRGDPNIPINGRYPNDFALTMNSSNFIRSLQYPLDYSDQGGFNQYFNVHHEDMLLGQYIGANNYVFAQGTIDDFTIGTTPYYQVLTIYADVIGGFSIDISILPRGNKTLQNRNAALSWGTRFALKKVYSSFNGVTKDEIKRLREDREAFPKIKQAGQIYSALQKDLIKYGLFSEDYVNSMESILPRQKVLPLEYKSDTNNNSTLSKGGLRMYDEEGKEIPIDNKAPKLKTTFNIKRSKKLATEAPKPEEKKEEKKMEEEKKEPQISMANESDFNGGTTISMDLTGN